MSKSKPKAQLRTPIGPPPEVAEAFIGGEDVRRQTSDVESASPKPSKRSQRSPRTPKTTTTGPRVRWRRTVSERADGTPMKRLTVYLPETLAVRLAIVCDEHGQSMSEAITELVKAKLKAL